MTFAVGRVYPSRDWSLCCVGFVLHARPAVFADVGQGIGSQLSLPGVFETSKDKP